MANLFGTGINQVPTNGMLGSLAFQDKAYVSVDAIGIGTTFVDSGTASQPLQVAGGAYIFGNVGIGTTNPSTKFVVYDGNTSLSSTNGPSLSIISRSATVASFPQLSITHCTSGFGGHPVVELLSANGTLTSPTSVTSGQILGGYNTWGHNGTTQQSGTRIEGIAEATFSTAVSAGLKFTTTLAGTQTERVRITGTGNVGIGTTSPSSTLDVRATGATIRAQNIVSNNYSVLLEGNSSGPRISFGSDGGSSFMEFGAYSSLNNLDTKSRDLKIFSTSAPGAFILKNATGNVGIGTTDPSSQLHITGQFQSTQANSTATGGGQIYLNGATGNRIDFNTNGAAAPTFTTRSAGTKIVLYPSVGASLADYAFGIEAATLWSSIPDSSYRFKWYAGTTNIASLFGTGQLVLGTTQTLTGTASQPLQVDGGAYISGNLGVGNNNGEGIKLFVSQGAPAANRPVALITDDGTIPTMTSGATLRISNDGSGNTFAILEAESNAGKLVFTNAGNLGIGTTNPLNRLTVYGAKNDTTPILALLSGNTSVGFNNGAQIAFGYDGTSTYQHFIQTRHNAANLDNAIDFYVSDGTQNNTLTSGSVHTLSLVSGSVGIGTTNPTSPLHVIGNVTATDFYNTASYPTVRPTLDLAFAQTKVLDSRITFTRASTATYVGADRLIKTATTNEARFDHNPATGESLGLLLEEARTNLVRNNTMVGAVAGSPGTPPTNGWVIVNNATYTSSILGTGIENGINYIDIQYVVALGAAATGGLIYGDTPAGSALTAYTGSYYLKLVSGSSPQIRFIWQDGIDTIGTSFFNLTNSLTRYTNTFTTAVGATLARFAVSIDAAPSGATFVIRVGLPQTEQGAFATSVIPTTTATATRAADLASITGTNFSSWYNQTEGTLFADAKVTTVAPATSLTSVFALSDGTTSNRITVYKRANADTSTRLDVSTSGSSVAFINAGTFSVSNLIAISYRVDDFAISLNGLTPGTDTLGTVPTVSRLNIGNYVDSTFPLNGTIRRLTYWPVRLTDAQLQTITA